MVSSASANDTATTENFEESALSDTSEGDRGIVASLPKCWRWAVVTCCLFGAILLAQVMLQSTSSSAPKLEVSPGEAAFVTEVTDAQWMDPTQWTWYNGNAQMQQQEFDGWLPPPINHCPSCTAKKLQPPAVVIPTYERDICKLKYTVKSISVHDPKHYLGDVYILWVSKQPMHSYQGQLDEIRSIISSTHKVYIWDFSPQVRAVESYGKSGWIAQQVMKLKIAAAITAEYYIVLDSKNTLIRDVRPDTFFTNCNQAKIFAEYQFDQLPDMHKGWYLRSAQLMNIPPITGGIWPASITPMTLHRQTVLNMLASIQENAKSFPLCQGRLCQMLESHATEFTMYLTYQHDQANPQCRHVIWCLGPKPVDGLWRGQPYNWKTAKAVALGQSHSFMFGIQAGSYQLMSFQQKQQIKPWIVKIYKDAKLYGEQDLDPDKLMQCLS